MFYDSTFQEQLNNKHKNIEECVYIINNVPKVDTYKDFEVYRYNDINRNALRDFFICNNIICATVWYIVHNQVIYTSGLWQNKNNRGLIEDLIENYYSHYKAIVSDNIANKNGKMFWKKILEKYISSGHKVTVLYNRQTEQPYNPSEFENFWSHGMKMSDYVFKIYY